MNSTVRQLLNRIAGRKNDSFQGSVMRQHRDEHLCIAGSFAGRFCNPRAKRSERLGAASGSVVNR
jgi:hypothetical protein